MVKLGLVQYQYICNRCGKKETKNKKIKEKMMYIYFKG